MNTDDPRVDPMVDEIESMSLPVPAEERPSYRTQLADDARDRFMKLCTAAADQQRRLAQLARDEAAQTVASLRKIAGDYVEAAHRQMAEAERNRNAFVDGVNGEIAEVEKEAEHRAAECDALADRMEASAQAVAHMVVAYADLATQIGLHTEDLHERLKAPVPHNGKATG